MNREIWWSSCEEPGLEHLNLKRGGENIVAESVILRVQDGNPFRLSYRIGIDSGWRVREVEVGLQSGSERQIKLRSDVGGGNALPEFAGCFEIDISATPFTNTLPIKRLAPESGESVDISVVYFLVPEMIIKRSEQRYSRLEKDSYRFEEKGLFDGFSADLTFDEDGLVIDYPNLFRRVGIETRGLE
ncbi:MAG TPA: putative glycolipid-binding domain-containing protein [Pyrinomonadaceae bacterium]|jgi:hypothetical protein